MLAPQRIDYEDQKGKKKEKNKNLKIKKGWLAVFVGLEEGGGKLQRFVIPMWYLHDPLLKPLMDKAFEVYGYNTSGPLRLPCSVDEFLSLQSRIEKKSKLDHLPLYPVKLRYLA